MAIPIWAAMALLGGLGGIQKAATGRENEDKKRELTAAQQQYSGFTGQAPAMYTPGETQNDLQGFLGGAVGPTLYGSMADKGSFMQKDIPGTSGIFSGEAAPTPTAEATASEKAVAQEAPDTVAGQLYVKMMQDKQRKRLFGRG